MKIVLINATAARCSGALTVLTEFMQYIQTFYNKNITYHLLTSIDKFHSVNNIIVHIVKSQNWLERIIWDRNGLYKWSLENHIEPDLIFSLQNTSSRFFDNRGNLVKQLVYYHQSLPLIRYRWDPFKKEETMLFLYAHFYSFFVKRYNKNSSYIVQLPYIKKLFLKKFKNIKASKVYIVKPNKPVFDINNIPFIKEERNTSKIKFLYPATALSYKNHKILIEMLVFIFKYDSNIIENIEIIFTIDMLPRNLKNIVNKFHLNHCIKCIGQIPRNELLSYYKSVDCLLFPSLLETFGLPLLEAAAFGLKIFSADLPYAREVLENYDNVIYIDPYKAKEWVNQVRNFSSYKKEIFVENNIYNTWVDIINIIKNMLDLN